MRSAAASVVNPQERDAQSMGRIPDAPAAAPAATPSYPWGRQPLSKHFDYHAGVLSVQGKRCGMALVWLFPVAGCKLGHIDPEPGRSDLFDPKYQVPDLRLPKSALATGVGAP